MKRDRIVQLASDLLPSRQFGHVVLTTPYLLSWMETKPSVVCHTAERQERTVHIFREGSSIFREGSSAGCSAVLRRYGMMDHEEATRKHTGGKVFPPQR